MKQKTIQEHEEQYWHIPKLTLLPVLGLIIFSLLAYGNYQLIDKQVIYYAFNCSEDCNNLQTHDLLNIYPIIGEYLLISLALISLVAIFKRGYKNIKAYKDEGSLIGGLTFGLIGSLIGGLIVGLTFGLIGGLIGGLIVSLIFGLIDGLIGGLIGGLIFGLIGGLIVGLIVEFE